MSAGLRRLRAGSCQEPSERRAARGGRGGRCRACGVSGGLRRDGEEPNRQHDQRDQLSGNGAERAAAIEESDRPPRGRGRLLETSSVPIVEQAREHAPNDDRRVTQYGLSGSDTRTARVVLGDGKGEWTVRGSRY